MQMKPIKAKPHFYSVCLSGLQTIAMDMGYNLVVHGSMNRDLDLIAVAWTNNPSSHINVLKSFSEYLGLPVLNDVQHYHHTVLPGKRDAYVINLNRGGKFNGYQDAQYYLDISFTPFNP